MGEAVSPICFTVRAQISVSTPPSSFISGARRPGLSQCIRPSCARKQVRRGWLGKPSESAAVGLPSYSQAFRQKTQVTGEVGFSREEARLRRTPQGTRYHATSPGARRHPFAFSQAVTQRAGGRRVIEDTGLGERDPVAGVLVSTTGREQSTWKGRASHAVQHSGGSPSLLRTGPDGTCCTLITSLFLTSVNTTPEEPSRRSFPRN